MKKIIKTIMIVILCLCVLGLAIFGIYKLAVNIHSNNIKNYDWLSKYVTIKKNSSLGNDIYSVYKSSDINIYNENYIKVIDKKINKLTSESYEFSNPLMIYNPYGTNELSLNIYFDTDENSSLVYTVSVDDKKISDFTRTLNNDGENNLTKDHEYQIIGLVPGYKNKIKLSLKDSDGNVTEKKTISIDLSDEKVSAQTSLDITKSDDSYELSNGLFTILGNDSDDKDYVSLYDNDGILRAYIPIIGYRAHRVLFKDDLMYFSISQTKIASIDRLGKVVDIYKTGYYYLHHDYTFDDDGNLLVLANNTKKNTEEDCVIKIDTKTKKVTEVVDLEDIFPGYIDSCDKTESKFRDEGEDGLDWIHINSIVYEDGNLLLSSRETSSIIKLSNIEKNPKLEYIISDKSLWEDTDFESYVLNKVGDFTIHAGQHSLVYVPTDEDGVYYLKFFNNNYGIQNTKLDNDYKSLGITNDNAFGGDKSYYYVYKVDENNKTFELVDDFDVDYSGIVSSVQIQDNGNIIVDSGVAGVFAEYTSDHKVIRKYKAKLNKYMLYRVFKYTYNDYWFK